MCRGVQGRAVTPRRAPRCLHKRDRAFAGAVWPRDQYRQIAEGTIFSVFESKDALIDAVVLEMMDPAKPCAEFANTDSTLNLESRLVLATKIVQRSLQIEMRLFHVLRTRRLLRPHAARWVRHRHQRGRQQHQRRRETVDHH